MAAITNTAGESLELSFGGAGVLATFTSKSGKAVSRTFPWSGVSRFVALLMDEFKDNIADWADEQAKEGDPCRELVTTKVGNSASTSPTGG